VIFSERIKIKLRAAFLTTSHPRHVNTGFL